MCMPNVGFPLVNDLPTNNVSQSAPIDGVLPVNVCSIVVAVAGTASNQCEPTHLARPRRAVSRSTSRSPSAR